MQARETALTHWLENTLNLKNPVLKPLAGDASFRRYYRAFTSEGTSIIMDAPPEKESITAFIQIAGWLNKHAIKAPCIKACDPTSGFVMLEDFGDTLLLSLSTSPAVNHYYQQALDTLIRLEQIPPEETGMLPLFDAAHILQELRLFPVWFLNQYLHLTLTAEETGLIEDTFSWLTQQLTALPQVLVHRDYHSRNLMVLDDSEKLGVIDFQDAMRGPIGYDLVSLLKDCYVQWPCEQITHWVTYFYNHSQAAQALTLPAFTQAFTLCGIQRHLKVLGIFSRLCFRDHKKAYLQDLPLTLDYLMNALPAFEPLRPFHHFLQTRVSLP